MEHTINQLATTRAGPPVEEAPSAGDGPLSALARLGQGRLLILGLTALGLLGFFGYLVLRVVEPEYGLLYAGLDLEDSAAIVGRLEAAAVPFRLREDGATILVPASDALRLRMTLAEEGLPQGGSVGYEIFDQLSAFGTSTFLANVNLRRALEGELARTIAALTDVKAARVHLVMPKRELFRRERVEPSAAVTLKLGSGRRLRPRQVLAIQHLVAASVPGLSPERITLVDDRGTLLARGGASDEQGMLASDSAEFQAAYEQRLKETVEELLERSLGPGRVRAEVHADMDFDRVTTTEETYDPEGRVVRSTQSVEEETSLAERDRNENVTVGNNLPNGAGADAAGRTSSETGTRSEETINYEISRTVRNHTQVGGRIRRLSVAVLVDGRTAPDESGELVYTELDEVEIARLTTLVRSAVGFEAARGDVVEVINMPFNLPVPIEVQEPWLDIDKNEIMRLVELLVLAVIALVLILMVLRPAVKHLLPQTAPTPALAAAAQSLPGAAEPADRQGGERDVPALIAAGGEQGEVERIDLKQVDGPVAAKLVRQASEAIDSSPDEVAGIIRTWLHQN